MQKKENQFGIHVTLRNNKEKRKIKVNILRIIQAYIGVQLPPHPFLI